MFHTRESELIAAPGGNMVAGSYEALRYEILNGIEASHSDWTLFVLDLNAVLRIDIRGVNLIQEVFAIVESRNAEFMAINCHEPVLKVLQMFRMHRKFPIGIDKSSAQLAEEERQRQRDAEAQSIEAHALETRGHVPRPN